MTAKEKAQELFDIYDKLLFKEIEYGYNSDLVKQFSLIAVD